MLSRSKKYIVLLITCLSPTLSVADFRCPNTSKIVMEGMNQYMVENLCGEPAAKSVIQAAGVGAVSVDQQTHPNGAASSSVQIVPTLQVEEWTYDFGSSSFMKFLIFEGGILKRVRTGGYGFSKKSPKKK